MMWLAGIAASIAATWTQPAGDARLELGLGGTAAHELGGTAGLWVGLTDRVEVGANAAHAALGMLNLHGRATALQGPRGGYLRG
jgi:hypothetical protein